MMKKTLIAALLLVVAGVQSALAQRVVIHLSDNHKVRYSLARVDSISFEELEVGDYDFVDMGLPSGTLWADRNVGADNPEESGAHYAWGETEPKEEYSWATYKYCNGTGGTLTKYCIHSSNGTVDNITELEAEDDAASTHWGNGWQTPSDAQLDELFSEANTTMEHTTLNGVNGLKLTSKANGNTLFFPAAGYYDGAELQQAGVLGWYMSRTLFYSSSPLSIDKYFTPSGSPNTVYTDRCRGKSVRPVRFQDDPYDDWLVMNINVWMDGWGTTGTTLNIAETLQLTASVYPHYAKNKVVTWESSDEAVATVTSNGLVTAVGPGTCSIIVRATDGSGVTGEFTINVIDPHPYVDLGLPSGTLWATMNIGAESPEQYGTYFAWGETSQKTNYSYDSYTSIDVAELPADKDAATVNWGELWQMPCREQIRELVDEDGLYVTKLWTTQNGVNGWKITSKSNGNSIFLPAAGLFWEGAMTGKGERGGYWGRTLDMDSYAWCIYFNTGYCGYNSMSGATGMTVRPVRVQEEPYTWPVLRLELPATLALNEGESAYLSPLIIPSYAHYDDIVLESSDESVATVSGYEVTGVGSGTCTITCRLTNDSSIYAECQVTVTSAFVDLALPSGTLWAKCNVGASTPEEYGDYFAWGETTPKTEFGWGNYALVNIVGSAMEASKYNTQSYFGPIDNKTELEEEDDAAIANTDGKGKMPTLEQMQELLNDANTTRVFTTQNGVIGTLITSVRNSNTIFLPAAGGDLGSGLEYTTVTGAYWSRTLDSGSPDKAYGMGLNSSGSGTESTDRYYGMTVRPVKR